MEGLQAIERDQLEAVLPVVAEHIADALARDLAEVRLDSRLIEDLGAESIDFLDIVFRLEQAFQVAIPRGQIVEDARGNLTDDEFAQDGRLSEAAVARLREVLSEAPADSFRAGMKVGDIPTLFTVETFCKLVVRARRASD